MKRITLSAGKHTLVDDEDYEWLNQWKWSYVRTHVGGYAHRVPTINGKRTQILMHRLLNKTPEGFVTDHKNQNKLDNRKNNLRTVTHSQNQMNTSVRKNNRVGVKGITFQNNRWRARIFTNGKSIFLGGYKTLDEAIKARQQGELTYHSDITRT